MKRAGRRGAPRGRLMGEEYNQQQKKLRDGVRTFAKKDEMAFQLMVARFISVSGS